MIGEKKNTTDSSHTSGLWRRSSQISQLLHRERQLRLLYGARLFVSPHLKRTRPSVAGRRGKELAHFLLGDCTRNRSFVVRLSVCVLFFFYLRSCWRAISRVLVGILQSFSCSLLHTTVVSSVLFYFLFLFHFYSQVRSARSRACAVSESSSVRPRFRSRALHGPGC